jgi:hypothetical protein
MLEDDRLRDLVAEVAAAYFSNSDVAPRDIHQVISQIAVSLCSVSASAGYLEASARPMLALAPEEPPPPASAPTRLARRVVQLRPGTAAQSPELPLE